MEREIGYVMMETVKIRSTSLCLALAVSLAFLSPKVIAAPPEEDSKALFQRVFEDPDNVELNFKYAKAQIREGNMLGASSTLERMLLQDPNRAKVRLLYAIVLFRLDSLHEAENEFKSLRELKLSSNILREVDGYLKEVKRRKKRTHLSLRESVAFQYDSNRNAAPSSKQRLFADLRVPVSRQNGRQSDTSFLNITSVDLEQDLGFQAGHKAFGSFTYFLAEQTEQDPLDLSSYQQEYGLMLKNRFVNVTPSILIQNVLVSRETFLRSQGGILAFDRNFFERLDLFAQGRLLREEFVDITENLAAHERKGDRIDMTWGLRYALLDQLRFSLQYTFADKTAKEEYNAYTSSIVGLGLTALPGNGQFLTTQVEFGRDNYEAPDFALYSRHRRDKQFQVRFTYGAPLNFFFLRKLPQVLGDVLATVTYEYDRSLSNVTNYTYRNNKVQTMLTQRWEF